MVKILSEFKLFKFIYKFYQNSLITKNDLKLNFFRMVKLKRLPKNNCVITK